MRKMLLPSNGMGADQVSRQTPSSHTCDHVSMLLNELAEQTNRLEGRSLGRSLRATDGGRERC
jgi:hypothetical protein